MGAWGPLATGTLGGPGTGTGAGRGDRDRGWGDGDQRQCARMGDIVGGCAGTPRAGGGDPPCPRQHDVELTDPRGRTPLELAVSLGHLESVRVLLRHNANVGRENANGWTGTQWGGGNGDLVAPAWGIPSRGAGGAPGDGAPLVPVLQEAVSTGDPEMVQLVLQYRDYQRATRRLAGIPELLSKLRRVRPHPGWGPLKVGVGGGRGDPLDPPKLPRTSISSTTPPFPPGTPWLSLPPTQDPALPGVP